MTCGRCKQLKNVNIIIIVVIVILGIVLISFSNSNNDNSVKSNNDNSIKSNNDNSVKSNNGNNAQINNDSTMQNNNDSNIQSTDGKYVSISVPSGYRLVWNDEFGNGLSKWNIITESSKNAPVHDGNVYMTAYYKQRQDYISRSQIESKYSFKYGYIEFRGKLSYVYGVANDLWLMPADEKSSPEIDILERPGKADWCLHSVMYGNGIWDSNYAREGYECSTSDGGYHTFGLLWEPDNMSFFVDGVLRWQAQQSWLRNFNVPMKINMALCSDIDVGCKYQGMGDATNPKNLPTNFAVDYARVYQRV